MQNCAGFISAESLYMFRASSAHRQEYLKLVRQPLVHVLSLQVGHHISLLGPNIFKTSTAATGTCVIVAGKSSHLLIRACGPNKEM